MRDLRLLVLEMEEEKMTVCLVVMSVDGNTFVDVDFAVDVDVVDVDGADD